MKLLEELKQLNADSEAKIIIRSLKLDLPKIIALLEAGEKSHVALCVCKDYTRNEFFHVRDSIQIGNAITAYELASK